MSVDGPRSSVFIFQSSVHSHRVLLSLEQLRQKDQLCDLTVEVHNTSFRAHSSVLASCSHYFYGALTNHSPGSITVSLPHEVTVEGFEPLLQFAYTAKLHFTKENILEIRRCAKFLGFQNLDDACFEFLIPKFSEDGAKGKGKTLAPHEKPQSIPDPNHQKPPNGEDVVPGNEGSIMLNVPPLSSVKSLQECPTISHEKEILVELTSHHMDEGQEQFCMQNCDPQLPSSSTVLEQVCPFLSSTSNDKLDLAEPVCTGENILISKEDFQEELAMVPIGNTPSVTSPHFPENESSLIQLNAISQICPLNSESSGIWDGISSVPDPSGIDTSNQVFESKEQMFHELTTKDAACERSTVEREVAEHLAKGFWQDLSSNLNEPLPLDSISQMSTGKVSEFNWLKDLDLGAAPDDCPFLRDMSSSDRQSSGGDTLSREDTGDSAWVSPINSGENSECESDEECEQSESGEQVQQVDLPFPVEQISSMTHRAFLQMLKREHLTPEQLAFVQDIRRRGKNRVAAQRCRKRKLDCIYRLEGDIKKLKLEKEKLLQEHNQLKFGMEEVSQKFSGLCQSLSLDTSSIILTPPSLAGPDGDMPTDISLDGFLVATCPEGDAIALRSQDQNTVTHPSQ